jgi:ectoine hydroxylase-related dioxygenase (phytanoyl-CoA dioxygenase family)
VGFDSGEDSGRAHEGVIESGYHVQESVIASPACDQITRSFEAASLGLKRAGLRNLMRSELIRGVATQRSLLELVNDLHGKPMLPFKATLFSKTGKANWLVAWHQDTALPLERFEGREGWGATSRKGGILFAQAPAAALAKVVALRIHLDPSTTTNGPLRVIPGTHNSGVLSNEEIHRVVREKRGIECLVGKGGVIAMAPLLLHASSKAIVDEPRRVLHIEYTESLELDDGIMLAFA